MCELKERKGKNNTTDPTIASFILFNMVARIYRWYNPEGRITVEELTEQIINHFLNGFYGRQG